MANCEGSRWVSENVSHMDGTDKQCAGNAGTGSLLGSNPTQTWALGQDLSLLRDSVSPSEKGDTRLIWGERVPLQIHMLTS